MNNEHLKKEIISTCLTELEVKFESLSKELEALRESAANDTKSSMGDKYETGREMIMQERGKLEDQKTLIAKQISFLKSIDQSKTYKKVEFGSLVMTDSAIYFISIALGPIQVAGKQVFVISANSPIGQVMLDKEVGERITFNGKEISLIGIE